MDYLLEIETAHIRASRVAGTMRALKSGATHVDIWSAPAEMRVLHVALNDDKCPHAEDARTLIECIIQNLEVQYCAISDQIRSLEVEYSNLILEKTLVASEGLKPINHE